MTDHSDLPYYYRRKSVSSDRTEQIFQLRENTLECIQQLQSDLETKFDQTVYKTDILEAIVLAGLRETSVITEMERMGYHQTEDEV